MPETRIALIMAGGASLGSFSGGALAQVLELLEHVERGPAKIDVVTGASAGSMTLGIVAHHLFAGHTLGEIRRALRAAWVEEISLAALCPADPRAHASPSVFTDAAVRTIAERLLPSGVCRGAPHPLFADEGLLASFALTNLNGIPVRTEGQTIRQPQAQRGPVSGEGSVFADAVQTTFHDDAMRFLLWRPRNGTATHDTHDAVREAGALNARMLYEEARPAPGSAWTAFREAAIASGAFPAAFPPVRLGRAPWEYGRLWPDELGASGFVFDFLDGGILRNEPLREAIQLAAEHDRWLERAGREIERVFILIDPNVSGTNELWPLGHNQSPSLIARRRGSDGAERYTLEDPAYIARLGGVMGRFAGVLASQATYRDWLKARRVNSQVEWRAQAQQIIRELRPAPGSDVETTVDTLLRQIYVQKYARSPNPADPIADVDALVARDLARLAGDGEVSLSTRLLLLLDLIANLREKRKLNMVAITPTATPADRPVRLAGGFLANFGGFFDERFRAHDFAVGEHVAAAVLSASIDEGTRPLLRPGVAVPPLPAPVLPPPSYAALGTEARERFETLLRAHVDTALARAGVPALVRPLAVRTAMGKLRAALAADGGGPRAAFVVRLRNCGELYLRGGALGDDLPVRGDRSLHTVVVVQQDAAAEAPFRVYGPHLHGRDGVLHLELWQPGRLLRRARQAKTISLAGNPRDWYDAARRHDAPVVDVELAGDRDWFELSPLQLARRD
jgi:predicted acylesterase/phospholipase RssA